jgi:hypothetical protein
MTDEIVKRLVRFNSDEEFLKYLAKCKEDVSRIEQPIINPNAHGEGIDGMFLCPVCYGQLTTCYDTYPWHDKPSSVSCHYPCDIHYVVDSLVPLRVRRYVENDNGKQCCDCSKPIKV